MDSVTLLPEDSAKFDLLPMDIGTCCRIEMPKQNWASKNNYLQDAGSEKKQPASFQWVVDIAFENFRYVERQNQKVKRDRVTPFSRIHWFFYINVLTERYTQTVKNTVRLA